MTDTDERLLTAAKLREQVLKELDGDDRLLGHTGLVSDGHHRSNLSFVDQAVSGGFASTDLGREVMSTLLTDEATQSLVDGNHEHLAHFVGITEQDLDADEFSYTLELIERVENNNAPLFLTGFGLPNTGKTGHILHDWHRAWQTVYPDGISISNASVRTFDRCITSLDELVQFCLDHPDVQKFVFIDEGSTHFDARTNSHEVASQFSPFSKRFAKLSVDFATIGHTVKDVHPEVKRQTTTFFHKPEKKQVQFFEDFDDDDLLDPVFPDPVDGLEKPPEDLYDPDDWSPLQWDLDPTFITSAGI
jgi:hypothetical protein